MLYSKEFCSSVERVDRCHKRYYVGPISTTAKGLTERLVDQWSASEVLHCTSLAPGQVRRRLGMIRKLSSLDPHAFMHLDNRRCLIGSVVLPSHT